MSHYVLGSLIALFITPILIILCRTKWYSFFQYFIDLVWLRLLVGSLLEVWSRLSFCERLHGLKQLPQKKILPWSPWGASWVIYTLQFQWKLPRVLCSGITDGLHLSSRTGNQPCGCPVWARPRTTVSCPLWVQCLQRCEYNFFSCDVLLVGLW